MLLDICMPKMDGMQTCVKLRANPVTSEIPVIFLTGFKFSDQLEQAIDMGANDFLEKPINPVELNVRIRAMLLTRDIPDEIECIGEYIKALKTLRTQVAGSSPTI